MHRERAGQNKIVMRALTRAKLQIARIGPTRTEFL
jgi:hypothetical protein